MSRTRWLPGGLLLIGCAAWLIFQNFKSKDSISSSAQQSPDALLSIQDRSSPMRREPGTEADARRLDTSIAKTLDVLNSAKDGAESRSMLAQLAEELRRVSAREAADAIGRFLDSRRDAATRLSFRIEKGGNLGEAPTFRTWLLDQLGRLNPPAAAEMARTILATPDSADEWAVALRDFARVQTSPEDKDYLQQRLAALLRDPRWQQEQSIGWLEAFDVAVHVKATHLTPDFARMITRLDAKDRPAAHAAFLTLDRLVQAEPATVLGQLQADPELLAGRELTRADYFARADVRDPEQRALLEQYLLDERRQPEELAKFAGTYPSGNYMVSDNLLTSVATPGQSQITESDRAALAVAEEWLTDPRFARLRPQLMVIRHRLRTFVQQATALPVR